MTGKAGYSVFEVLVAFAIMAIVLSTLLPGQARLVRQASVGSDRVLAYDFALSRLAHYGVSIPLEPREDQVAHGNWIAVESVRSNPVQADSYVVNIEIIGGNGGILAEIEAVRSAE